MSKFINFEVNVEDDKEYKKVSDNSFHLSLMMKSKVMIFIFIIILIILKLILSKHKKMSMMKE